MNPVVAMKFACLVFALGTVMLPAQDQGDFRSSFPVDRANLVDAGRSDYFILEPGYSVRLAHGKATLVITVLDDTRIVDGIRTRVVEERESSGGRLVEVSRNFFAIDRATGDVYYFGEEVDIYRFGKIVSHEGAWLAGVNGARFGLMLPGKPRAGDRYYQEVAPKVALDRAEVRGVAETLTTPAGAFKDCVRVREMSDLERGTGEKWYAPNVGLIRDDNLVLVRAGKARP
jgi:hypothetical protein